MSAEEHPPPDMSRWGLHAFSLGARSTPHGVVAMDDNGALLYHARDGVSFDQLRAVGIVPTQSQLALLRLYDLIEVDDGHVAASFPIVGPQTLAELRPRLRTAAATLAAALDADVAAIVAELRRRGHAGHDYAVIFGHVVDGLLWDELKAAGLAPVTELSVEKPLWNGAFWAIYPPRAASAGVNEVAQADAAAVLVWTRDTLAGLRELVDSGRIEELLRQRDPAATPVVAADDGDAIHARGRDMAGVIAAAFDVGGAARDLVETLPGADVQQATVILAHELIWDVMDVLVETGALTPPPAMRGAALTPETLLRQVFVRTKA